MPEIRYREVYDNEGNIIAREPYEVSDEQLRIEELLRKKEEILKKPTADWTLEDVKTLVELLVR